MRLLLAALLTITAPAVALADIAAPAADSSTASSGMFSWVSDFVHAVIGWFVDQFISFITWVLPFAMDVGCKVIEKLVAAINLPSDITAAIAAWGSLPPQVTYLINGLGIPQAISIWVGAVTIRAAMNFLPGWLTRI